MANRPIVHSFFFSPRCLWPNFILVLLLREPSRWRAIEVALWRHEQYISYICFLFFVLQSGSFVCGSCGSSSRSSVPSGLLALQGYYVLYVRPLARISSVWTFLILCLLFRINGGEGLELGHSIASFVTGRGCLLPPCVFSIISCIFLFFTLALLPATLPLSLPLSNCGSLIENRNSVLDFCLTFIALSSVVVYL